MVSSAASLGEFSARSYDEHHPSNFHQGQIDAAMPGTLQFVAPGGGGYVTLGAMEAESGMLMRCQGAFVDQQGVYQHQSMHLPPEQFIVAPETATNMHMVPAHMSGGAAPYPTYTQPSYALDYSLPSAPSQQQVHFHNQQMQESPQPQIDISSSMHFNHQMHIALNPSTPHAQFPRQMLTHSAFNDYRLQGLPAAEPCPAHEQPREYACPMGLQQQVCDSYTGEPLSFACPPGQMNRSSAHHHQVGTSTSMPVMHVASQQNLVADLQAQGPQTQMADGTVVPRMVLQLSDAISEQQRQQQRQQQYLDAISEQQQQQSKQQYLDAADYLPLAPPSVPCQSIAPMLGDDLASVGSMAHDAGKCKPCAFFYTKGCENGFDCEFCHICEPGEKKKRRKEKIDNRRSMRQLRQALSGGLSSWWDGVRGGSRQNAGPD